MNVQELIDKLNKIEDKTKKVECFEPKIDEWTSDIDVNDCGEMVRISW